MEPLRPFHEMITDEHLNDYLELERKMCDIIYMLHYLHTETFAGTPARQVVHTLERFRECFQKAQVIQQEK